MAKLKISPIIYASMKQDIATVAVALCVDVSKASTGDLWNLLDTVSRNRAYDDTHPGFVSGRWKRLLPYDGRDYCFFYSDGCNDTHVATALRAIQNELAAVA